MKMDRKEMDPVAREVLGEHMLMWWCFFYQLFPVSVIVQL